MANFDFDDALSQAKAKRNEDYVEIVKENRKMYDLVKNWPD